MQLSGLLTAELLLRKWHRVNTAVTAEQPNGQQKILAERHPSYGLWKLWSHSHLPRSIYVTRKFLLAHLLTGQLSIVNPNPCPCGCPLFG
jgi:hypothetical protein